MTNNIQVLEPDKTDFTSLILMNRIVVLVMAFLFSTFIKSFILFLIVSIEISGIVIRMFIVQKHEETKKKKSINVHACVFSIWCNFDKHLSKLTN